MPVLHTASSNLELHPRYLQPCAEHLEDCNCIHNINTKHHAVTNDASYFSIDANPELLVGDMRFSLRGTETVLPVLGVIVGVGGDDSSVSLSSLVSLCLVEPGVASASGVGLKPGLAVGEEDADLVSVPG